MSVCCPYELANPNVSVTDKQLTVVLDEKCAGLVQPVSAFARTIVFTRRDGFLTAPRAAAEEMHGVLQDSGVAAPYLLVGASYAAFTLLLFASRWPGLVAGMILIDPSHPLQGEVGLRRLSRPDVGSAHAINGFRSMLRGFGPKWEQGCREVSVVTDLGNLPMVILEAGALEMPVELSAAVRTDLGRDRHELLRRYAAMSSRSSLRVAEGAGHDLVSKQPGTVVECVRELIAALRADGSKA
jgi:pimeloyl-ACP methyl ester carboxylesterase